ncbi:hypothetical protein TNCV_460631 [Trichonephila clavipes]|nr:hypothetical protein TNCV_460631 [Trichonephila clavipes]
MAPTKPQKAFCAVEYAKAMPVITVQRNFQRHFGVDAPGKNSIKRWQLFNPFCEESWELIQQQITKELFLIAEIRRHIE